MDKTQLNLPPTPLKKGLKINKYKLKKRIKTQPAKFKNFN